MSDMSDTHDMSDMSEAPAAPATITTSAVLPAAFPPEVTERLFAVFDADEIEWLITGKAFGKPGHEQAQVALYVKRVSLLDRWDAAFGPGNWQFAWEPLAVVNGVVTKAKGILTTAYTDRPYMEIGVASDIEPDKGAVTDAEKRLGSLIGAGRYLARAPRLVVPVEVNADGKKPRVRQDGVKLLRAFLQRWDGTARQGRDLWNKLARNGVSDAQTDDASATGEAANTANTQRQASGQASGQQPPRAPRQPAQPQTQQPPAPKPDAKSDAKSDIKLAQVKQRIIDLSRELGRPMPNLDALTQDGAERVAASLEAMARRVKAQPATPVAEPAGV